MRVFEILSEKPKTIAVFGGRFQPFHLGHYRAYKLLCSKFGAENVYIATSGKTNLESGLGKISPFDFDEKVALITKLYKIDKDNIVKTASPLFINHDILSKLKPNYVCIAATGIKDAERFLDVKNYSRYKTEAPDECTKPISSKHFYYLPIALQEEGLSGTEVRKTLLSAKTEDDKKKAFKDLFGVFNEEIMNLVLAKLKQVKA